MAMAIRKTCSRAHYQSTARYPFSPSIIPVTLCLSIMFWSSNLPFQVHGKPLSNERQQGASELPAQMTIPPSDTGIWDVFMSQWILPSVSVAVELKLFDIIHNGPKDGLTIDEIADKLSIKANNGLTALIVTLLAQKYLVKTGSGSQASYLCAESATTFLVRSNPDFYWGNMLYSDSSFRTSDRHRELMDAILNRSAFDVVEMWESGELTVERAEELSSSFHSHSTTSAMGAAASYPLGGTSHLLDVGGGSGCYSEAFVRRNEGLQATVMDLAPVCEVAAKKYFGKADEDVRARLHTLPKDFFRDDWPAAGYDAIFMSNILHDWSFETGKELLRKSFESLPSGGKLLLHEMLLDSNHVTAACFSIHMAVFTRGQQFYFDDLKVMMEEVGFVGVSQVAAHGYYSIVSGNKPDCD